MGVLGYLFAAYAAQGDLAGLQTFIADFENQQAELLTDPVKSFIFYYAILYALHFHGHDQEMAPYKQKAEQAIAIIEPYTTWITNDIFLEVNMLFAYVDITDQWGKARPILEALYPQRTPIGNMVLFYLGIKAAKAGDTESIVKTIHELAERDIQAPDYVFR